MRAYYRMYFGKFKKKTVKVGDCQNLISGKKVFIIDTGDYMMMIEY